MKDFLYTVLRGQPIKHVLQAAIIILAYSSIIIILNNCFSPLNMLDGYENRMAYCAIFGSMTFELTSILWNPYGRFTSFGIGHSSEDNEIVTKYPVVRRK